MPCFYLQMLQNYIHKKTIFFLNFSIIPLASVIGSSCILYLIKPCGHFVISMIRRKKLAVQNTLIVRA